MSTGRLEAVLQGLRTRFALSIVAWTLPVILALAALLMRFAGAGWMLAGLAAGLVAVVASIVHVTRKIDLRRVVSRLDTATPALDDSSDLLLRDDTALSPLQRLQRERVLDRLAHTGLADIRPAWPLRLILAAFCVAVVAIAMATLWPRAAQVSVASKSLEVASAVAGGPTRLVATHIDIEPPGYTALPARSESALDLEAPEGSQLRWRLRFDTTPRDVALVFHDGTRIALTRDGADWVAQHQLLASTLYRIALVDVPALQNDQLHRLDAIVDQPPEVAVAVPERTLTLLENEQNTWPLVFEASDDYGIATARLSITLAQGSGEQITVRREEIALRAESGADVRHRRFRHAVDLGALGFARGDDVIVRLAVSDTRMPQANVARSPSFILRWPPPLSAQAEGIDGIVQKTLPAYFRSQRQIIIDSETLLADRASLSEATFVDRSDAIGVDQKILRLRYGQFLGEEFESGGAPHTEEHAHETEHIAQSGEGENKDQATLPEGHTIDDGHDHAPAAFGNAGDVVAEYGHTHDHAEAATLLDPETKRILKAALSEMWQAELQLRLGDPEQALPYENRALGYIKQVQQSTRIYLARVGLELPPVDEKRRLSGDRASLRDRRATLAAADAEAAPAADFYRALGARSVTDPPAFEAWLRENQGSVADALGVIAALDGWRRDETCNACRERLLDVLWPLLPLPATGALLRRQPDAAGDAYLDALRASEPR